MRATLLSIVSAALAMLVASATAAESLSSSHAAAMKRGDLTARPLVRKRRADGSVDSTVDMLTRANSGLRFPYGQQKVRGVSLGGWLVIENFISPSIYEQAGDNRVIDEWSFGKYVSPSKGEKILRDHYDNFITEDDIAEIASYGLNHIRVPFPYWGIKKFGNEPYMKLNQYAKLKEAAGWADKHGLKMMIELHTVPGGANPYDHGGHTNHSNWLGSDHYEGEWLDILNTLASEFSQDKYPAVTGISIVNEPNGDSDAIYQQYQRGYNAVRNNQNGAELLVIIGDVFHNPSYDNYWNDKFSPPKFQDVMVDTHVYRLFDQGSIDMTQEQRLSFYCGLKDGFANFEHHLYTMVGEWSPAFTDCAPGLNGRFRGARYDGSFPGSKRRGSCDGKTGHGSSFSSGFKANLKRNWSAQADAYSAGAGWIMWTWKTENHNADEWSYRAGVQNGWIPRDPTQLSYTC